jgi:zinc protease
MNPIHRSALAFLLASLAVAAFAAEDLPRDERIKTGKLANGVRWMYRQHNVPPGKMALLIHVDTGSLNEEEHQRGLAHFLEHMAFNGTENFAPGKLLPYFESIGMEFGADLNAFTSFDQTAYMLFLPNTKEEEVGKALMVLSDYAFRQTLTNEELDKERGVILAELRAGQGAQQRLRDQLFEKLFAGMRLGQRLPIGIEKVIKEAPRTAFEEYYRTWYRPERITLIMVGDAAPEPYLPLIEKWFGEYRAPQAAKANLPAGLKPFPVQRAVVLTDPEVATGSVDVFSLSPGRPPITTVEQARVELVEDLASWIMSRRFSERVKKGAAAFRSASASVSNLLSEAMLVNASAEGEPKQWQKMLDQLTEEVTRAREYGFLKQELDLAKKEYVANAEDAVRKESTQNARNILMEIRSDVNDHEPTLSAEQMLALYRKLLPGIELEEVSKSFAGHFGNGNFAYVLTLPSKGDVPPPTEDELLAAARAAQAHKVDPPKWEERPTELLEKLPEPGKFGDSETDKDLEITSGWLANGARVHQRFMDYKKDTILINISLAGGRIEETADNAGVTEVAARIFAQPATRRLTSSAIQDIMTGKNIAVRGFPGEDALSISVQGSPKDLEIGLQLVYALLTEGRLESSAFDKWREQSLESYEEMLKMPQFVAAATFLQALSGNDPRRYALLPPAQVKAQSVERAQAWFDRLAREAPIEVAVVGEMKLNEVMPLVEKYIGALSKRPRTAEHLDKLRKLARAPGPIKRGVEVETITPQAVAMGAFVSADAQQVPEVRALNLVTNIFDTRLVKRLREELGETYSPMSQNRAGEAYTEGGHLFCMAIAAPDQVQDVISEIDKLFEAFAASGPTDEELANAKKQIANRLDTQLREPSFWASQLAALDLHKLRLENLKNIPQAYNAITAEQMQSVFKKYCVSERRIDLWAVPVEPAGKEAGKGDAAKDKRETSPATQPVQAPAK